MSKYILLTAAGLGELLTRIEKAKPSGQGAYYGYVFIPNLDKVNVEAFTNAGLEAMASTVTKVAGYAQDGIWISGVNPLPTPRKFQVSYKAGGRWGSRTVLATSQAEAEEKVAKEIASSISSRNIR